MGCDPNKEQMQNKIIYLINSSFIPKQEKTKLIENIKNDQLMPLSKFIKEQLQQLTGEKDVDEKFKNIADYILKDTTNIFMQCSDPLFLTRVQEMLNTKLNDNKMFSNDFLSFVFAQVHPEKNLIISFDPNVKDYFLFQKCDESTLLKENNTFVINHDVRHFNHLKKLKYWSDKEIEDAIKQYINN
jgi:hypothetical protein